MTTSEQEMSDEAVIRIVADSVDGIQPYSCSHVDFSQGMVSIVTSEPKVPSLVIPEDRVVVVVDLRPWKDPPVLGEQDIWRAHLSMMTIDVNVKTMMRSRNMLNCLGRNDAMISRMLINPRYLLALEPPSQLQQPLRIDRGQEYWPEYGA